MYSTALGAIGINTAQAELNLLNTSSLSRKYKNLSAQVQSLNQAKFSVTKEIYSSIYHEPEPKGYLNQISNVTESFLFFNKTRKEYLNIRKKVIAVILLMIENVIEQDDETSFRHAIAFFATATFPPVFTTSTLKQIFLNTCATHDIRTSRSNVSLNEYIDKSMLMLLTISRQKIVDVTSENTSPRHAQALLERENKELLVKNQILQEENLKLSKLKETASSKKPAENGHADSTDEFSNVQSALLGKMAAEKNSLVESNKQLSATVKDLSTQLQDASPDYRKKVAEEREKRKSLEGADNMFGLSPPKNSPPNIFNLYNQTPGGSQAGSSSSLNSQKTYKK